MKKDSKANAAKPTQRSASLLRMIGPGVLLAATGVGSGDLATASIVGGLLGAIGGGTGGCRGAAGVGGRCAGVAMVV